MAALVLEEEVSSLPKKDERKRRSISVRRRGEIIQFLVAALEVVRSVSYDGKEKVEEEIGDCLHAVDKTDDEVDKKVEEVRLQMSKAVKRNALLEKEVRCALSRCSPRNSKRYDLVDAVLPNLWLGGWTALNDDCRVLRRKNIHYVVSIVTSTEARHLPSFIRNHMHIICRDDAAARLDTCFPALCRFIHLARSNGDGIFLHCGAGISRSATAVAAYIMWLAHFSRPSTALAVVRAARPQIRPNRGFIQQLAQWGSSATTKKFTDVLLDDIIVPDRAAHAFWISLTVNNSRASPTTFCSNSKKPNHIHLNQAKPGQEEEEENDDAISILSASSPHFSDNHTKLLTTAAAASSDQAHNRIRGSPKRRSVHEDLSSPGVSLDQSSQQERHFPRVLILTCDATPVAS